MMVAKILEDLGHPDLAGGTDPIKQEVFTRIGRYNKLIREIAEE